MNTNEKNAPKSNEEVAANNAAEGSNTAGTAPVANTEAAADNAAPTSGNEGSTEAAATAGETAAVNTEANADVNTSAPVETAAPTAPADVPPTPATFNVVVTGKVAVKATGEAGATLRSALKAAGVTGYEGFSYQDEKGKPVSLDRKLSEDLKLAAIAKASGG